MAIAIDDRSVQREAVLTKSSSFETDSLKADPDDGSMGRVKRTLGISKGSKQTGEEGTRDAVSSVFDFRFLLRLDTYILLSLRLRRTLIPTFESWLILWMESARRFYRIKRQSATRNYNEISPAKKRWNSESSGMILFIKLRILPESALDRTYLTAPVDHPCHNTTQSQEHPRRPLHGEKEAI
jgi:hypothetical protein